MKEEREYPRFDIRLATFGESELAAFLIDHDTGQTWLLDKQKWVSIPRSNQRPKKKSK